MGTQQDDFIIDTVMPDLIRHLLPISKRGDPASGAG